MRSKPAITVAIILAAIITVAAIVSAMQTSRFAQNPTNKREWQNQ